jgi:hypothetical protein
VGAWYVTRGAVARATDVKASAYASDSIDRAIETASTAVDKLCHRGARERGIPAFAPWDGTLTFDWPTSQDYSSWTMPLGPFALTSLTALDSGGNSIPTGSVFLEPYASGPPYFRLSLNRGAAYVFSSGSGVGQRSLAITGTWAAGGEWWVPVRGDIPSSVTADQTLMRIDAPVDVGHILLIDDERLIVTERTWVTAGVTATIASATNAQALTVPDGSIFFAGEEIVLDAERMLIRDVVANTLMVQRAVGGSALAAHDAATVYVSRTFTVERGALGTTAAAHDAGAAVAAWRAPSAVQQLTLAYVLDIRAQESSGYARTIGSGEGERQLNPKALTELEGRVRFAYGRNVRMRSV